jgi:chromosome partitioning protein
MAFDLRDRIAGRLRNLVASPLEKGSRHATVLAIASNKGGVGKTTTAVNLSVTFQRLGARVLLIDLDPQAHVSASLRAQPAQPGQALSDVLLGRLRDVCEATFSTRWPDLDLAGSEKMLSETETILAAKIGKELILDGALAICRSRYDLIVLDCPPNLGTLTLNGLCAADHLLIPTDMSVLALEGVGDILNCVETLRARLQRHVQVSGIVATRFDKRTTQLNASIEQSFNDMYGDRFLATRIPQSSAVNRAHLAGEPLFDHAPRSPGALAYLELAHELGPRLGLSSILRARAANESDEATEAVAVSAGARSGR